MSWGAGDRLHFWTLATLVAWGSALRVAHLDTPMRPDEAATFLHFVSRPLREGLSDYALANNHLLHTLLAHASYLAFGDSPWAVRLPALVAGVLIVPMAYVVARLFYGRDAALLACGLTAASSELIKYSTNARGYTLVGLFFLVLVALAHALLRAPVGAHGRVLWILFAVCATLGVWSVASMLYGYGTVVTWLLLSAARGEVAVSRRRFALQVTTATVGAAALVVVLYSPVLVWGDVGAMTHSGLVRVRNWSFLLSDHPQVLGSLWRSWHAGVPHPLVPAVAVLAALALVMHRRLATTRVPLALAVVLCPVPVILAQRVQMFPRVWLFLLPLYLALVAAALAALVRRLVPRSPRARPVIVCALALALAACLGINVMRLRTVYLSAETGSALDAEAVTAFLKPALRPGDRVAIVPVLYPTFAYYFQRAGLPDTFLGYAEPGTHRVFDVIPQWGAGEGQAAPPATRPTKRTRVPWSEGTLLRVFPRFLPVAVYERHRLDASP